MAEKQETLIYIEQDNKIEAEFMSRSFVNSSVKNRAYINALGAELVTKYLASEGINVSNIHNIHSISKILEKIDVSDIMLPNIHIDVRVVFDEDKIFIPKSHFQFEITPDVYVVLKLVDDFSRVEFLGYFEPKLLNLKNQNADYYFFEKEKLSAPQTLAKFVKEFTGNTSRGISQEDMLRGRELSIAMADHNISDEEQKELIELLLLSDELRDSILEFDNFETLSYSVGSTLNPTDSSNTDSTSAIIDTETVVDTSETEEEPAALNEDIELAIDTENDVELDESFFDDESSTDGSDSEFINTDASAIVTGENEEIQQLDNITIDTEPAMEVEESVIDTEQADILDTTGFVTTETDFEPLDEFDPNGEDLLLDDGFDSDISLSKDSTSEEVVDGVDLSGEKEDVKTVLEETSVDEVLSDISTENSEQIQESVIEPKDNSSGDKQEKELSLEQTVSDAVQKALGKTAEAAAAGGAAMAGAAAGESIAAAAASAGAMKLAGISGDLVNDLVKKNLENQHVNLDRIDYAKTTTNATEIPENIAAYDLSTAKMEADLEAEASGQFDSPKDLSELKTVDQKPVGYGENIEQEVIDLNQMEAVDIGPMEDNNDSVIDFNNISQVNSPTAPVEDLDDKLNADGSSEGIDLPNLSSFTINADGTSALDNLDINLNEGVHDEHLVDLNMNPNQIVIEKSEPLEFNNFTSTLDEQTETVLDDDFADEFFNDSDENAGSDEDNNSLSDSTDTSAEDDSVAIDDISLDDTSTLLSEDLETSFNDIDTLSVDEAPDSLANSEISEELNMSVAEDNLVIEDENFDNSLNITEEPLAEEPLTNSFDEGTSIFDDIQPQEANTEDLLSESENLNVEATIDDLVQPDEVIDTSYNEDILDNNSLEQNLSASDIMDDSDITALDNVDSVLSEEDIDTSFNSVDNNQDAEVVQSDNLDVSLEDTTVQDSNTQAQDWMEDTNYDNLQDVELPHVEPADVQVVDNSNEINEDEFITEPEPQEKVFNVIENSTVISDMNFKVGEIPIDINNSEMPELDGPEQIDDLYDANNPVPGSALLQNPGRLGSAARGNSKVGLGVGLGILGVLLALIIVGIIGFSVSKMIKQPKDETPQPITDDTVPTSTDNGVSDANTLKVDQENVVNMDNTAPALSQNVATQPKVQTPTQPDVQKAAQPPVAKPKNTMPANSYLEVSKLTWEIPDYISYNSHFKQYFQAVGKSLKLSLTSDLLLATEYSYSDQVRVSILYDKDGTFKDAKILLSSGSSQIDKIVLQTVNQTLKVLKAPHSVGNDESTTVILKIYF